MELTDGSDWKKKMASLAFNGYYNFSMKAAHPCFLMNCINFHIAPIFSGFGTEHNAISAETIRRAFHSTEEGFLSHVSSQWPRNPQLAAVGSCCLCGVVCNGVVCVANAGDSRVVLGRLVKATGEAVAVQLSAEHNAAIESVRKELHSMHPDDPNIVVLKHNVWRVKGLIQVLEGAVIRIFCYSYKRNSSAICYQNLFLSL